MGGLLKELECACVYVRLCVTLCVSLTVFERVYVTVCDCV